MAFVRERYKNFVREHPALVSNAEQLLHWVVWNPDRFTGSEYAYEAFNAAVGLVGIYNQSILAEKDGAQPQGANWYLWLAAVEQVHLLGRSRLSATRIADDAHAAHGGRCSALALPAECQAPQHGGQCAHHAQSHTKGALLACRADLTSLKCTTLIGGCAGGAAGHSHGGAWQDEPLWAAHHTGAHQVSRIG